jgi:signal transduction histidine kinase
VRRTTVEDFDLAELARSVVAAHRAEADRRDVALLSAVAPAVARGRSRVAELLVTSVLQNAIRHNEPTGWAGVTVRSDGIRAVLTVVNTGPVVSAEQVDRLAGTSAAFDMNVEVSARREGGLVVEVGFPAV